MTVTEVVRNFRACLLAVLPFVERAGIPWQRPSAYDDWDRLVDAIYEALVANFLSGCLAPMRQQALRLARYDLLVEDYRQLSFLEVIQNPPGDDLLMFHALGTRTTAFDVAEIRRISKDGKPLSDTLEELPFDGLTFRLRLASESEMWLPTLVEAVDLRDRPKTSDGGTKID